MTSIIKLQVLSGAMDESPPCYILQVDEVRILLDCGWDEKFDSNFIKEMKKYVNTIDAVLLSYPDVSHLGALPYLVGKLGLNCPIYATIPVYKMGQMFMYDLYLSHHNMHDFSLFSLDDVDAAFDKIIQLKYNQSISLKGKGYGITITPLPAGHMIGGTIWKIVKIGEEDIIYAVDFNHKKERHLNGCELEKLQRPSLLITDCFNVKYQQARRRARDEKLMTNILQTMRNGGNVLIAVDTAGRILEIAHMLDQLWKNKDSGLIAYSLAFLTNVSYNTVEFAKSQIEWMSDKLMKNFEGARNNPFQFKHINICHNLTDLAKVPSPKVVLASTADLESGYSRELFVQWAANPSNSFIFTSRTSPGTLARDLIENGGNGRKIEVDVRKRVELEGAELEEFLLSRGNKLNHSTNIDTLEDSSDSEYDLEMNVITGKHDIVLKPDTKAPLGFFKSNRKHVTFPFAEEKYKGDEYGEIINLDDYRIADSTGDPQNNETSLPIHIENIKREENGDVNTNFEKPTKCVVSRKLVEVNAQIQYIDFEGRSDGESILKILSQLRPRRVIVIRGLPNAVEAMTKHCEVNIGAKVFAPKKGEIVDATTEAYIYQIRLTENLVSRLQFQKGKDAEVAWLDAEIGIRKKYAEELAANLRNEDNDGMEIEETDSERNILTLDPLDADKIPVHNAVFINELRLFDFKQILMKNNISSEFSNGVLWCNNGNIAIRRLDAGRVAVEGCLCEDYYRIRELLYQQYAIV